MRADAHWNLGPNLPADKQMPLSTTLAGTVLRSSRLAYLQSTSFITPTAGRRMSTQALVTRWKDKNILEHEDVKLPTLGPKQVLTKVITAAQNPTDIKSFDQNRFGPGAMLGCDICGSVEQVGSDVTRFKQGDRIAALLMQGRSKQPGAYAKHTIAEEDLSFKVPEGVTSEEAATVPLACNTTWLALLSPYSLGIDRTKAEDVELLIWGGSSSVGQYAIQIAKLLGFKFATTCRNRKVVESLGAEHVFDYTSATVVEDIKKTLPNIKYVLDCIGTEESSALGSQTVVESGGKLCTIQPGKRNTEKVEDRVKVSDVLVFTAFYEELNYGKVTISKRKEDRDLSHELYESLPSWLESGKMKANKPRVIDGGLEGVEKGFDLYRSGKISGEKVVYRIG